MTATKIQPAHRAYASAVNELLGVIAVHVCPFSNVTAPGTDRDHAHAARGPAVRSDSQPIEMTASWSRLTR
jgi:hypothetical protein